MKLTTENAHKFLGCTIWVRWLGNHVKRLYVGQWPDGGYYYMHPDGATCCPISSPYSKDMPLEMLRIETDEKLKIHPGHTATESYHTLNDMRAESWGCESKMAPAYNADGRVNIVMCGRQSEE